MRKDLLLSFLLANDLTFLYLLCTVCGTHADSVSQVLSDSSQKVTPAPFSRSPPTPFFRFPDLGLKMKRKSYGLITTAVTSIKCYLKVNRLHMLKTLELLTDHCKVSRIFNNLQVMLKHSIFSPGQLSSGTLRLAFQNKLLSHSTH